MSQRAARKEPSLHEIAKAYVDKQLEAMQDGGLKTEKISDAKYEAMIEQVMKSVEA
jgi:hypothetical protein